MAPPDANVLAFDVALNRALLRRSAACSDHREHREAESARPRRRSRNGRGRRRAGPTYDERRRQQASTRPRAHRGRMPRERRALAGIDQLVADDLRIVDIAVDEVADVDVFPVIAERQAFRQPRELRFRWSA